MPADDVTENVVKRPHLRRHVLKTRWLHESEADFDRRLSLVYRHSEWLVSGIRSIRSYRYPQADTAVMSLGFLPDG